MRVAIYHNLPAGGAHRVLWEQLRRTGAMHEYELFTIDEGRDGESGGRARAEHALAPFAGKVHEYRVPWRPRGPAGDLAMAVAVHWLQRRIAAEIDAGGFDLAFVHGCRRTQSPGVLLHLRTPSIYFMQEIRRRAYEADYARSADAPVTMRARLRAAGERWITAADRRAVHAASQVLCNSTFSLEAIARAYGRWPSVCALGVDTEVFAPGPEPGVNRVLAVGAIESAKAHDLAVRALGLLPADKRPALEIVFERCVPSIRADLETLAQQLGVELHFAHGISDRELAARYRAARLVLCTAKLEPFGLTSVEALASGTPVVAVREGGFREVIEDGVDGVLVARDPLAVAAGVERVLEEPITVTDGRRSDIASRWSWDASVARLLQWFDHVAAPRP